MKTLQTKKTKFQPKIFKFVQIIGILIDVHCSCNIRECVVCCVSSPWHEIYFKCFCLQPVTFYLSIPPQKPTPLQKTIIIKKSAHGKIFIVCHMRNTKKYMYSECYKAAEIYHNGFKLTAGFHNLLDIFRICIKPPHILNKKPFLVL